jgi:Arc/MetJ-type ribon-helix-helix transcriptional regulator
MKMLNVRLPEPLVAQIEAEAARRQVSKSDVVRDRLEAGAAESFRRRSGLDGIADLVGAVDGLPADLSARKKDYLRASGYGRKRSR